MRNTVVLLILLFSITKTSNKNSEVVIPLGENLTQNDTRTRKIAVESRKQEMFKFIYLKNDILINFLLPYLDEIDTKNILYLFHFLKITQGCSLLSLTYETIQIKIVNIYGIQFLHKFQELQISNQTIFIEPIIILPQNFEILIPDSKITSQILTFKHAYLFPEENLCPITSETFFHEKGVLTKYITFQKENKFVVTDGKFQILAKGVWPLSLDISELVCEANNLGCTSKICCKFIFYVQRMVLFYSRYNIFAQEMFLHFENILKKYTGNYYTVFSIPLMFLVFTNVVTFPFHLISLPFIFWSQNCWTQIFISALHANFYFFFFPWAFELLMWDKNNRSKLSNFVEMFNVEPKNKNNFALPPLALKKFLLSKSFCDWIAQVNFLILSTIAFDMFSSLPITLCFLDFF